MSIWIQTKYASMLQFKLERFKIKKTNPYVANFRCPLCGDSDKNKTKTRGYLLQKKDSVVFKCHNCQESMSLMRFLGKVAPTLQDEMRVERVREECGYDASERETALASAPKPTVRPTPVKSPVRLVKLSTLDADHPARVYVAGRQIPTDQHHRLYYVDKFKAFVNSLIPGKFESVKVDHARLVMPFFNRKKQVVGFNARAFDADQIRYLSIMLDEDHPKVFGLDQHDRDKDSFIFEGPIDSLFMPNSLAMAGASVGDLGKFMDPARAIFVLDNEPRNYEICAQYTKLIASGHRIVIWPSYINEKDVNDMILHGGLCQEEVSVLLHKHTYSGAVARLRFNEWKKV